jgi:hypothetical protein
MKELSEDAQNYVALNKLTPSQTVLDPTTINVTECPHVVVQIPDDKLLVWRLHRVILSVAKQSLTCGMKHSQRTNQLKQNVDTRIIPAVGTASLQLFAAPRSRRAYSYRSRSSSCRSTPLGACFWCNYREMELGTHHFPKIDRTFKSGNSFTLLNIPRNCSSACSELLQ